jgi:extradiol dioxygenase family protein
VSHRNRIFHLSIPCADLGSAEDFYVGVLGCHSARRYADRITLDFFGDQVVCHLSPGDVEEAPSPYPRHFGLTFRERSDFDDLVSRLTAHEVPLLEPPGRTTSSSSSTISTRR